ncbi:MAG: ferritin-like domain-containing protein [Chloroflexota bacterium]|jgi:ferritin-like metal-binding protein YciE
MEIKTFEELFEHELEDLRSAEQQLIEALPKMAEAANDNELKQAFKDHLQETKTHLTRIDQAFKKMGKQPKSHTCKGMQGLIKEGEDVMQSAQDPKIMDVALIGAAQRVEHYEISAYGTARAHAEAIGHVDIADILQTTLDEEGQANKRLTKLAEGRMAFKGANEKARMN